METTLEQNVKMVGFINARNNESYQSLAGIGNTWKYDLTKVHPKLVETLYKQFDTFDVNSNGIMQMEKLMYIWPERVKEFLQLTAEQLERLRSAIQIFFGAFSVTEGLKREDWVEGNQVLSEAERERKLRGEPTLDALLGNAYFDVLDEAGSDTVSLSELKTMMNVFQVREAAAYTFFQKVDKDHSGTLEREEMHALFTKFWLEEYDPQFDGIYQACSQPIFVLGAL